MKIVIRSVALATVLIGTAATALALPPPVTVPDGGSTAALLGAAAAILLLARSRFAQRK